MVSVACFAIYISHFDMWDVRKIDAVRLSGIGKPWDLFSFGNIFF